MNIKFNMPELLIVFSLLMYPQSFAFAMTAFSLGVLGRLFQYMLDYSTEMKQTESLNENLNEAADALKNLFGSHGKQDSV
jgi:hypothetical protein